MRNRYFSLVVAMVFGLIVGFNVNAQVLSDELGGDVPLSLHVGMSGQVEKVMVAVGDQVQVGQVLVALNTQQLTSQLSAAYAQHKAVKMNSQLVAEDYERQQELYDEGSLSTVELQLLKLKIIQAKAQVVETTSRITDLKRKIASAQVVAPVAGEIIAIPLKGQWTNLQMGMTRLIKLRVK